jgi:hypothetical protein
LNLKNNFSKYRKSRKKSGKEKLFPKEIIKKKEKTWGQNYEINYA